VIESRRVSDQAAFPLDGDPRLPAPIGATVRVVGIPRRKFTVKGLHRGGSVTLMDEDSKWHNIRPERIRVPKVPKGRQKGGRS
jgi:hypothetical protein